MSLSCFVSFGGWHVVASFLCGCVRTRKGYSNSHRYIQLRTVWIPKLAHTLTQLSLSQSIYFFFFDGVGACLIGIDQIKKSSHTFAITVHVHSAVCSLCLTCRLVSLMPEKKGREWDRESANKGRCTINIYIYCSESPLATQGLFIDTTDRRRPASLHLLQQ